MPCHLQFRTLLRLLVCLFPLALLFISPSLLAADDPAKPKVVQLPMRTDGPKSLDPAWGSTVYDNRACCQVYETLLQYKYMVRPSELEPLLLTEMPATTDGLSYRFKLKRGVLFHDDPCFPGGKGRELVSKDVFYSWKRLTENPRNWWLLEDTIAGLDEYREEQNKARKAGGIFDFDAPVFEKRFDDVRIRA